LEIKCTLYCLTTPTWIHPKILNSCVVGDKLQDVDETKSVIAEEQKINLKKEL